VHLKKIFPNGMYLVDFTFFSLQRGGLMKARGQAACQEFKNEILQKEQSVLELKKLLSPTSLNDQTPVCVNNEKLIIMISENYNEIADSCLVIFFKSVYE
jgi:hypothetical protein